MNTKDKQSNPMDSTKNASWFERNVNLIVLALIAACVGLIAIEFVMHPGFFDEKHPAHFPVENVVGYQAGIGFVAFVTVVFIGKGLRMLIKRKEDYYD